MAITDARRRANKKWDSENMICQTIKVKKTLLEDFKAACAANGDKVNTVLRQAMENYTYKEGNANAK
jgi:uncharacterized protein (DUF4415 family)